MVTPFAKHDSPQKDMHIICGDVREELRKLPGDSVQCIVTSPPYNLGKKYEKRGLLADYLVWQEAVLMRQRFSKFSNAFSATRFQSLLKSE